MPPKRVRWMMTQGTAPMTDAMRDGHMGGVKALPRELILASAGSGKTYRISSHLIALLARGEPADEIFASTFTRKAAGEILDRVLRRLAEASLDVNKATELGRDTGQDGADPDFWLGVLDRTVRRLHRLNIGTLDAFFVRAVRSFAPDLGLPEGWTIADDVAVDQVSDAALQDVIANADAGELTALVRAMASGRVRRSVRDSLLSEVGDLMRVHYALDPSADDPWGSFGDGHSAGATPDERARLADRLLVEPVPFTKAGKPVANYVNGATRCADAIRRADWAVLVGETMFQRAITGEIFSSHPIPQPLQSLLHEARVMARADMAARCARQARALERFAVMYAGAVERRRRETGLYGFEDLTRELGGPDPLAARPDLFYRLDARTRHILLDEFQDTATPQWEALAPLLEELLAGHLDERAAVVVADPKQSIYGWRGGTPALVEMLQQRYGLDGEPLLRSWRSSPVVLDVVNRVFGGMEALEMWDRNEGDGARVRDWMRAFQAHEAVHPDLPGYVRIEAGPRPAHPGRKVKPEICRLAAEHVAQLRRAAPDRGIGVLTRTNAAVAQLILELKNAGVRASEEGGSPVTDAAPVTAVLALLRLADHPGNGIVRYHVARTPLGPALGYADYRDDDATRRLARDVRSRLMDDGYGRTIADLAAKLTHACDARERRRLEQLVELAFRFEPGATLRPSDFVTWARAQGVDDPTSSGVRVMTVHQAKGLEFDVVVLPDLDGSLVKTATKGPLVYRPEPTARITRAFPFLGSKSRTLFPDIAELAAAVEQARSACLRDSLSSLYVAMTRARYALHVIVMADGERGPGTGCTYARVLRDTLYPAADVTEGAVLYECGDPEWHRTAPSGTATGETAAPPAHPAVALRQDGVRRRVLPRRSPSDLEGGVHVDLANVLRLGAAAARDRGSIVHLWFEQVGWVEDGVPEYGRLAELARRIDPDIDDDAVVELAGSFARWLGVPAVHGLLSSAGPDEGAHVECEVPFIHRDGDVMLEGIIDRLVLHREDGRATAAHIIDYKTDAIAAGDNDALAARVDHYRPQLEAYRRAVAGMYGIELDRIRASLVFLERGAVVNVAP
jgi:ATP-dependent helicase/nuclease subunit A